FPAVDNRQFQLRIHAPTGTRIQRTEEITRNALDGIAELVGEKNVGTTLAYVGVVPASYPINNVYLWTSGPEEAVLRVALKPSSRMPLDLLKKRVREMLLPSLRDWLSEDLQKEGLSKKDAEQRAQTLRLSFEPADIVNEVMSFGASAPIEIAISGQKLDESRVYAERIREELAQISSLRDLQFVQPLDYPTIDVRVDREKLGRSGGTIKEFADSVLPATSSS